MAVLLPPPLAAAAALNIGRSTGISFAATQVVIFVALWRFQSALSPEVAAFLLLAIACPAGLLWWQLARPAVYRRRATLLRAAQRLVVTSPAGWAVVQLALGGAPPYGQGALLDYTMFALTVFFASCGAAGTFLVS